MTRPKPQYSADAIRTTWDEAIKCQVAASGPMPPHIARALHAGTQAWLMRREAAKLAAERKLLTEARQLRALAQNQCTVAAQTERGQEVGPALSSGVPPDGSHPTI